MPGLVPETAELEKMAMKDLPPPKGLSLAGMKFYFCITELYHLFRSGTYTRKQAHDIKIDLISAYQNELFGEKLISHHAGIRNRYSEILTEAEKEGCPICKKLVRAFDGRNEWNEELRDDNE